MTTIAIKDGMLAADSKTTDENGAFFSRSHKIYRLSNGALIGCAGDSDVRELLDVLGRSTSKKLPTRKELADTKTGFQGIMAFPNGQVFCVEIDTRNIGTNDSDWYAMITECEERWTAVGSGAQFAIGAMAAGKSAHDAVHIACRYDSFSQPPVKVVSVKETPPAKKRPAK
jgi:ATP-dependent protease HslVU (ClpYQ) peptidase subunit